MPIVWLKNAAMTSGYLTYDRNTLIDKALTPGMHGYSLLRPSLNQKYFYELFDMCERVRVPIEGLHTETGPGVFEAALTFDGAALIGAINSPRSRGNGR
jgi:hypothetical protein